MLWREPGRLTYAFEISVVHSVQRASNVSPGGVGEGLLVPSSTNNDDGSFNLSGGACLFEKAAGSASSSIGSSRNPPGASSTLPVILCDQMGLLGCRHANRVFAAALLRAHEAC